MNEAEVLRHVTKYNLPSSIEGSPRWHISQLQNLLAMVEKFGMPDFFLTLTVDEASSLYVKSARYAFVAPYGVESWMDIVASMYELLTNRYCCLRFPIFVTPHIALQYNCLKNKFVCFDQESCISHL